MISYPTPLYLLIAKGSRMSTHLSTDCEACFSYVTIYNVSMKTDHVNSPLTDAV